MSSIFSSSPPINLYIRLDFLNVTDAWVLHNISDTFNHITSFLTGHWDNNILFFVNDTSISSSLRSNGIIWPMYHTDSYTAAMKYPSVYFLSKIQISWIAFFALFLILITAFLKIHYIKIHVTAVDDLFPIVIHARPFQSVLLLNIPKTLLLWTLKQWVGISHLSKSIQLSIEFTVYMWMTTSKRWDSLLKVWP